MDGTFKVSLATPLGPKSGILRLNDTNGSLSGSIRTLGKDNPFSGGRMTGNAFEFAGRLNIGFDNIQYTARGTIDGDSLRAVAETRFGKMPIRGTRLADA